MCPLHAKCVKACLSTRKVLHRATTPAAIPRNSKRQYPRAYMQQAAVLDCDNEVPGLNKGAPACTWCSYNIRHQDARCGTHCKFI